MNMLDIIAIFWGFVTAWFFFNFVMWMIIERQNVKHAMQFGRAEQITEEYPENIEEIVNRELDFLRCKYGNKPVGTRKYIIDKPGCKKAVVVVADNRELWLEHAGLHDEQCNNWIALIKNDLNVDGVS